MPFACSAHRAAGGRAPVSEGVEPLPQLLGAWLSFLNRVGGEGLCLPRPRGGGRDPQRGRSGPQPRGWALGPEPPAQTQTGRRAVLGAVPLRLKPTTSQRQEGLPPQAVAVASARHPTVRTAWRSPNPNSGRKCSILQPWGSPPVAQAEGRP